MARCKNKTNIFFAKKQDELILKISNKNANIREFFVAATSTVMEANVNVLKVLFDFHSRLTKIKSIVKLNVATIKFFRNYFQHFYMNLSPDTMFVENEVFGNYSHDFDSYLIFRWCR